MKDRILKGWNLRRIFYILIGLMLIVQSILVRQWFAILFGGYFFSMGLFAFGCASGNCGNGSCYTPPYRHKSENPDSSQ